MDNNNLKKKWDRLASMYDFITTTEENAYTEVKRRIINTVGYDDKILELATGTGTIALDLCPHCKSIDASDFSHEMIKKANEYKSHSKYKNVDFTVADACNLDYEDNTYDVVILSNALHILPDPDKAMNEIKRVLRPGGKLIAPNFLHNENFKANVVSRLLSTVGFPSNRRFNEEEYHDYILSHDFKIRRTALVDGNIPMAYVEAVKFGKEHKAKITIK